MATVNPEVVTGALLKELIKKSNVSITRMAGKLDKTRSSLLAALKCSNSKPSDDEVTAILNIIGVTREEFEFQKKLILDGLENQFGIKAQLSGSLVDGDQRRKVRGLVQHLYVNRSMGYRPQALNYRPVC